MVSQQYPQMPLERAIADIVSLKDVPNRTLNTESNTWSLEAFQSSEVVQRSRPADQVAHETLFQVFTRHLADIPEVSLSMNIPDETQHMYWCCVTVDIPHSTQRQQKVGSSIGHAIAEWLSS